MEQANANEIGNIAVISMQPLPLFSRLIFQITVPLIEFMGETDWL
jgi:hypothetical protein